jgi:methionyl-tRNA formyltransferase
VNKFKVVPFINGPLGIQILEYLLTRDNVELSQIVLNSETKRSDDYLLMIEGVLSKSASSPKKVISWREEQAEKADWAADLGEFDYGVSVFFGHVLPHPVIKLAKIDFCNLHPSYLPTGRGAHPIPWSIINSTKQGVSIHRLTEKLDQGEIFLQKELVTNVGMNAGVIYDKALAELHKMFIGFFPDWIINGFKAYSQDSGTATSHTSRELEDLRVLYFDETETFENFIRRIQALTFSNSRTPIFIDKEGLQWNLRLDLKSTDQ